MYDKGDWLKAEDLSNNAVKVKIDKIGIEKFDTGNKFVLSFVGKEKQLVLNKTNAKVIANSYGDDEGAWQGQEIIMYPTVTEYQGSTVPCIRVRIDQPVVDEGDEPPF